MIGRFHFINTKINKQEILLRNSYKIYQIAYSIKAIKTDPIL